MILLVHGGAGGARPPTKRQDRALREALAAGREILLGDGPALDAVVAAVRTLERSGRFNAGAGAALQLDGALRLDAAVMEGTGLRAGAVAGLTGYLHPVEAARLVMERTPHVLLTGIGAHRLAARNRLRAHPGPAASARRRWNRLRRSPPRAHSELFPTDTVGAVALDRAGHTAAATSTGGAGAMLPGRIGDSPLIGCGLYADDRAGAVSMTGPGEPIIRLAAAKEICLRMERGAGPRAAAAAVLRRLKTRAGGEAGAIVLNPRGRWTVHHTTRRMAWAAWRG